MSARVTVRPPGPFDWEVRLPGSKSLTNRALLFAAVAQGRSTLRGWLDADDTRHMRACLGRLGLEVGERASTLIVDGAGGPLAAPASPEPLQVGTAGTVARFLLGVLAASPGRACIDGSARMRERPMAMLIDALREQGARIECLGTEGALPLAVGPHDAPLRGGEVRLSRPASSQFVSALAIAATLAAAPTRIVLEHGTPAAPYVEMTLAMLRRFGGAATWTDNVVEITPGLLCALDLEIEPDASAASYPLALAAIYEGRTVVPALGTQSLQGDVRFARVLERFGAKVTQTPTQTTVAWGGPLRGIDVDLADMPDMTLTAAVTALFAEGPTRIRGVGILRHHESDRLAAGATELRKLGAVVQEYPDGLSIDPPDSGPARGVEIDTYDDHRVAMAFALAGHVVIRNPGCVAKTYPKYFNDLGKLGMVERQPE